MPDRLSIGADVVEASCRIFLSWDQLSEQERADWMVDMEAAVREALDKLGLREEREEHGPAFIDSKGALSYLQARLVSDWRQVDAEPAEDPCLCRKGGDTGEDCPWKCPLPSGRVDAEPSEPPPPDLMAALQASLEHLPSATSEGER